MFIRSTLIGLSTIAVVVALLYSRAESFFGLEYHGSGKRNSIFNSILSSFFTSPVDQSLVLSNPFGLSANRPVSGGESIISFSRDSSPLLVDGLKNVPAQLSTLHGYDRLSLDARVTLSVALMKTQSDDFIDPLSLLWKGVGVRPIPDVRWTKHRGLFSLNINVTGVEEIDRAIAKGGRVVHECIQFIRSHYRYLPSGLNEAEIKWSWIFLNSYGVPLDSHKALIAPLIFARRSLHNNRSLSVLTDSTSVSFVVNRKVERGEEVFIDGSDEISDGFAFLFHGSWIADDSVHRGKFWLRLMEGSQDMGLRDTLYSQGCVDKDGSLEVWLSNDERELSSTRTRMHKCTEAFMSNGMGDRELSPSQAVRVRSLIWKLLKQEILKLQVDKNTADDPLSPIRFQYFNLLYNELIYWESMRNLAVSEQLEM